MADVPRLQEVWPVVPDNDDTVSAREHARRKAREQVAARGLREEWFRRDGFPDCLIRELNADLADDLMNEAAEAMGEDGEGAGLGVRSAARYLGAECILVPVEWDGDEATEFAPLFDSPDDELLDEMGASLRFPLMEVVARVNGFSEEEQQRLGKSGPPEA